jgi:hypothetical protein
MTPQDGDGVNRCSWTPTAEDVDCTILWPTEGPAGSWVTVHPAQQQQENVLFGFGHTMTDAMDSRVSLSTVLLMMFAAFAMYKIYQWTFSKMKKETKYEGYQPLRDTAKSSVDSSNGYHSISA